MENVKPDVLSRKEIEYTKKNSIIDGSAWSVMYGFGEQYVVPYAIRLGATNPEIGILSSVPSFIGSLFQIVGAKLTDNWQDRKKIVSVFVLFQAIILLPLFIVPFITKSIIVLTAIFSIYAAFANITGPSWSSWIGDVVQENDRAKYFSKRNKTIVATTIFSVLSAGFILSYFDNVNIWVGFGLLFCIAFIGRLISWMYTLKQYEPRYVYKPGSYFSFKDFLKRLPHTNFGNFVMYRSFMAFAVMIAAPFFVVYMLKELNFSYWQYTIIILAPMFTKFLTMTYWGKYSERFGTRHIMIISSILVAIIPLAWFFAGWLTQSTAIFYVLIIIECVTGFAWAGFELTTFNYILETVSPEKRARGFAYFNVVFGIMIVLGGLLGSYLVSIIKPIWGIGTLLIIFFISAIVRLIVALIFASRIKEVKIIKNIDEKSLFFDLVIAKPLNGLLSQTTSMLTLAGEGLTELGNNIDRGLEKIEPLRKNLEPARLRRYKKETYRQLVNHLYNKNIGKYFIKKKRMKKK